MPNNFKTVVNFRDGIQVDNDDIVSSNGFVGIGSTLPRDTLDVRGNTIIDGNVTASTLNVSGVNTLGTIEGTTLTISGVTSIGNLTVDSAGIVTSVSGVLTYYGDGGRLLNLPTSQWLDVDAGLGFTSIYAQGDVGIGTTNPQASLQIGASILVDAAAGVVTASVFEGTRLPEEFEAFRGRASAATTATNAETLIGTPDITVDNIVGASASITGFVTATNSLSVGSAFQANAGGIVTATTFVGALDGNAATATVATNVETGAALVVTSIASSASSLKPFQLLSNGLSTFTGNLAVVQSLGVGTDNPNPAYTLDVRGLANFENIGITSATLGNISIDGTTDEITGGKINFATGISTFADMNVVGVVTVTDKIVTGDGSGVDLDVIGGTRTNSLGVNTDPQGAIHVRGEVSFINGHVGVGTEPLAGSAGLSVRDGAEIITGITTGREGFTSGIGTDKGVKITVSGSTLTFTVDGVGSVDLTLT